MKPIKNIIKKKIEANTNNQQPLSRFQVAKNFRELRLTLRRWLKESVLIIAGIFLAAFGLESFLLPSKFIDGGATGIALLISEINATSLSVALMLVNLPFVFLGYKIFGKEFAVKAILAITGLAIVTATVHFPDITHDKLLVAFFGGFFLGAGIGLTVRGGGVLDGTEVLAIAITRKSSLSIGNVIMSINVIVFATAAYFLSIETALYSMITYLSASKTLDFFIEGIEEYTGITIISSHSVEISEMIENKLGRGFTIYSGMIKKRSYNH
ncbi:MAG: YitT family protein [Flavobacterium sp.]|nr:YitT family protein [Flavobacterium sp.]